MMDRHSESFSEREFWAGRSASILGESIVTFAIPSYLAIQGFEPLYISAYIGIVFLAETISVFTLIPLGKVLRNKNVLLGIEVFRLVCVVALSIVLLLGNHLYLVLMLFAMASGILNGCFEVLLLSIFPRCFRDSAHLKRANGIMKSLDSAANSAGTAIAGVLLDISGKTYCLVAGAAGYLVSVVQIYRSGLYVRERDISSNNDSHWFELFLSGRRLVRKRPAIRFLMGVGSLINFAASLTTGTMAVYVIQELGYSSVFLAATGISVTAGTILGGFLSIRLSGSGRKELVNSLIVYSLGAVLLASPVLMPDWSSFNSYARTAVLLGQFIIGLGCGMYISVNSTFQQASIPEGERVATFSVVRTYNRVSIPLGMIVGGAIAQASSAGYSFALSAILVTGICSATAFLSPKVFNNVI
ncbi:MFS transporter [Corynebacterium striatum]|uniref:MFS transporter n=1 Tax=Corynebacterium striatum TaxID=43770 RepID=UPI001A235CD5|nr:MFS transporter [Corynebacterium striatum]HAT1477494.1 MFS transporter [Corynebacterium striatum]HAT6526751.1 MFS transporter [Corynebacterium striatum]HAT6564887.1 MFS transporter [Corynebacterium striatum]HAT6570315.1 MFS transporter [Corynebacterium striatum]